jgi:hypothetical protein
LLTGRWAAASFGSWVTICLGVAVSYFVGMLILQCVASSLPWFGLVLVLLSLWVFCLHAGSLLGSSWIVAFMWSSCLLWVGLCLSGTTAADWDAVTLEVASHW